MATPGGMSGMREIQRQVITAMHAKKPAMRVRVDVSTLLPSKAGNITVWTFRKAENKVIVENILKFVSVPPEGISKESVPGVVMTVVQNMVNEKLLEEIPPRMILPAPLVAQMKKQDGGSKWTAYIKMTKAERDKEYDGVYYEETDTERIARIDKAKKEAATRMAAQAARKAARVAVPEVPANTVTSKDQKRAPGQPGQPRRFQGGQRANSNPYFL